MKQKSKKLIILFIISLVMILGFATMVNADGETYSSITIGANQGMNINDNVEVSLVLGQHESETLKVLVNDSSNNEVTNPNITWSSSDDSTVSVDSNGTVTARKVGKATITAAGGGISKTRVVSVTDSPKYVDFSNVKYTWENDYYGTKLKLSNISNLNIDEKTSSLKFIIKTDNTRPNLEKREGGSLNPSCWDEIEKNGGNVTELFSDNSISSMEKYVELNKDIYLWVVQQNKFEAYYNDEGKSVYYDSRIIVDGIKLDKFEYPTYTGLFFATFIADDNTQVILDAPCATQRKFTVKIGKVNDNNILKKIKNKESDGFASLEAYAKSNSAIYEEKVESSYTNKIALTKGILPLNGKIQDKEYYYLYIIMDDENGKYAPIEHCITLGQGYTLKNEWSIHFYGDKDFSWKDFSTDGTGEAYIPGKTETKAITTENTTSTKSSSPSKLPYTGATTLGLVIVAMVGTAVFFKVRNDKYKGI